MSLSQEIVLEKLKHMLSSMSDEYVDDMLLPNYTSHIWTNLSNKKSYLDNTIEKYYAHHENLNIEKIQSIYETLMNVTPYGKVVTFQNESIYMEIYKILGLIDATLEAEKLLNNTKEYPSGFAEHQTGTKTINTARKFYKNSLVGKYKVTQRGEIRLRYMMFTLYNRNKNLLNFFLHNYLVGDLLKFKVLHEESVENEIFLRNLEFFLMQKTTTGAVIKSLGILLYTEFVHYLKIDKSDAEVYVEAIIYQLFKEPINIEEINKHVYIKSSLGLLPIFGASKKNNLTLEDKKFVKNKLYTQLQEFYPMEEKIFDIAYEAYKKNTHIQYLKKYPVELFRENPKYSS